MSDQGPKITYIDAIIAQTKIPEKSTPSPAVYKQFEAWQYSDRSRRIGNLAKRKDERTSFVDEPIFLSSEVPSPTQYRAINVVSPTHFKVPCRPFTKRKIPHKQ